MATLVPVQDLNVIGIGEVLWDHVGDQRHLGGAPFNFTWFAQQLGAKSGLITRVGEDAEGREVLERMRSMGMYVSGLQHDPLRPTGKVNALTTADGSVSYDIQKESAWDFIEYNTEASGLVRRADVFLFGTLAQRAPVAQETIQTALKALLPNTLCVLDLNLRPPFITKEVIVESMKAADLVKINGDELLELTSILELPEEQDAAVESLMTKYDIATLVVTRGAEGATAYTLSEKEVVAGHKTTVADTIGCGDAFTAGFTMFLAAGAALNEALAMANLAGAYTSTHAGGTPSFTPQLLLDFATTLHA